MIDVFPRGRHRDVYPARNPGAIIALKPLSTSSHSKASAAVRQLSSKPGAERASLEVVSVNLNVESFKGTPAALLNNQAVSLVRNGKFAEALALYDQAIETNPDLAEAHGNRANLLSRMGRYREAISSYDKALEIEKTSLFLQQGQRPL